MNVKKRSYHRSVNVLISWLRQLVFMLVLLCVSRWTLYIFNSNAFSVLSGSELWQALFYGLRFDIFVLSIIAIPSFLYNILLYPFVRLPHWVENITNLITFLLLLVAIALNVVDAVYYPFTLKRLTYDIVSYLFKAGGGLEQLPALLMDFWYITAAVLLLSVFMFRYLLYKKSLWRFSYFAWHWSLLVLVLSAGLLVVAMRGGLQLKPIRIVDAGRKVKPQAVPLVLNTPFTLIKTYGEKGLSPLSYFKEDSLAAYYQTVHRYWDAEAQPKTNVVLIILESFSLEHIGFFNQSRSFTPFLDSLLSHSLAMSALANGKRSIEGIPAILSALPTLSTASFINSAYAGNRIQSIASYLKPYGYSSAFFHGGKNGTMSFDAYAAKAGFDAYYGLDEYPNKEDFDGHWGVWDEPYFEYVAYSLGNLEAPFVASLFSLSSHHPYQVPAAYKGLLPTDRLPIKQTIAYTDKALQQFFTIAKSQSWYPNTLFVITADHTSELDPNAYSNAYSEFRIPIAFFAPSDTTLQYREHRHCVQQTDIFPTIAHYLQCNDSLFAFGNSIFDTLATPLVANRYGHCIQFFNDSVLLQWQDEEVIAKYRYLQDSLLQMPLPMQSSDTCLFQACRAYRQQYNNRMIENRLLPDE